MKPDYPDVLQSNSVPGNNQLKPLARTVSRILAGGLLYPALATSVQAAEAADGTIEEVIITDERQEDYLSGQASMSKFTEALLDTPQSITSITGQMLEDRGAMSLDDALRNVPGITLGAGEFSWQGNNPSIRGFSSRNDMFLDGMRDLGFYTRDPFNLESVEVLQGPSSMIFGRGSTGGVVNQSSKRPLQQDHSRLHLNAGNAGVLRATADINRSLSSSAAFRVNVLSHQSEVPERDGAETDSLGVAPSLSLGMGSATQLTLSYLKLDSDSVPDYGLPWIEGRPANTDRDSFYGFDNDYLETEADIASAVVDHTLSDGLNLNAQVRYAEYSRSSRITEPQAEPGTSWSDDPAEVTVHRLIFSGQSEEKTLQAQLNLIAEFSTGDLQHSLVTGIEFSRETSDPAFGFAGVTPYFDYDLPVPATTLADPDGTYTGPTARRLQADTTSDTVAAFILDTIKFSEQWQLVTGIRWDNFETDYAETRFDENGTETGFASFMNEASEFSYRAALVFKPVSEGTIYAGWGTSFNPSCEAVTCISSGRNLTISNVSLDAEENRNVEVGIKWSLLEGALMVDSAVFSITKTNARVPDPDNPGFNILAGEQSVQGLSLGITGRLNDYLQLSAGYTWLDSEQDSTTSLSVPDGAPLTNVAENTLSLWLDWQATPQLSFGAGTRYVDERLATNSLPQKRVPDYWAADLMGKFEWSEHLTFKLNLTNLTNEYYFDQLHPWHVVPGPGFGAVFAVNIDY